MNYDWLGVAMFAGALLLLSFGYPVAFSLGGVAIIFALIGAAVGEFSLSFFNAMPSRIFGIMGNYTLLAIPYFIFLGSMLEKTGIAENNITIRASEKVGISGGNLHQIFIPSGYRYRIFYE